MAQHVIYAFGAFQLDTSTRQLRHRDTDVSLQPRTYRLLLYFLQHPGRLLTKEEIFAEVWKGAVVEDSSLRLAINLLRLALNDPSKTPSYIMTVNKHGYRFLPEVVVETGRPVTLRAQELSYHSIPQKSIGLPDQRGLAELLTAFDRAAAGNRELVFLSGARGIGKTTLLDSFLAAIDSAKFGVLRARCLRLAGAEEPFLPLLEALERRCREPCGRTLIEHLHRFAPTWLYQMLNLLEPEELTALQPKVAQINSGRMLREGADFFEALCRESALVLILDNAHWGDAFTLDLLNLLVSRCSPAKLLIIVSYRSQAQEAGALRIEEMRSELGPRGLCRECDLDRPQPVCHA